MTRIYIDIETCPAQYPAVLEQFRESVSRNFKAPSTLTKEQAAIDLGITDKDTIKFTSKDSMLALWAEKFKEEATEAAAQIEWRKTSFDGAYGHVCVIGLAFDDEPPISLYMNTWLENEANVLRSCFKLIDDRLSVHPNIRPTFIGHNLVEFDLRFLFQRCVVLGVKPSRHIPFGVKPWDDNVYDTMVRWGAKTGGSLDKITKALGLGGKGDIDGSMVWDYVRDGRIAEVAEYCKNDASLTRALYKRMTFTYEPATEQLADVPI